MKGISVIVVSWNACDFLRDCLESIRSQGGPQVREVIVVDNASTDGSQKMVSDRFPEVKLVSSKSNLGFAHANNLGIARASGEYLALVNSDVVLRSGCLEQLSCYLDDNNDVGLVGPRVFGPDSRLQPTCRRLPTFWNTLLRSLALDCILNKWRERGGGEMRSPTRECPKDVEVLSGCFWLARGQAIHEVGRLDERYFFYAEDVDWCKRFWDAGWKVVFVPQASITHFGGGSSVNSPLHYSIEMLKANLCYWRKHRGIVGQVEYFGLSVIHHSLRVGLRLFSVLAATKKDQESRYRLKRSMVCLRWLLTGKGV